jgi:hypothetical protein
MADFQEERLLEEAARSLPQDVIEMIKEKPREERMALLAALVQVGRAAPAAAGATSLQLVLCSPANGRALPRLPARTLGRRLVRDLLTTSRAGPAGGGGRVWRPHACWLGGGARRPRGLRLQALRPAEPELQHHPGNRPSGVQQQRRRRRRRGRARGGRRRRARWRAGGYAGAAAARAAAAGACRAGPVRGAGSWGRAVCGAGLWGRRSFKTDGGMGSVGQRAARPYAA